jgi:signal transduction histidine kinase
MPDATHAHRRRLVGSVRARVTTVATVCVFAVLVVAAILIVVAQRRLLTEELEETLVAAAEVHAAAEPVDAGTVLASPTDDDGVAQIVGADGTVISSTVNVEGEGPIAEPPPDGDTVVVRTVDQVPVDDAAYLVVSRRAGERVIHVGATLGDVDESTRLLAGSFAVGVPIVTAVLATLVWWLVGRTLRPVEAIRSEVDAIGGSDLHRRVPEPPGDDEIARLARTMNSMLARVETASDRQRRFAADASHELRTPLTRMRTELEVDLAHPDEADPWATHRSALEEVIGLQRLVDDLLVLARADAGPPAITTTPVALGPLARREAERAARPGLTVDVDIDGDATVVLGVADELGRAIANVVDNAARHARYAVRISVGRDDSRAIVRVADDGPGIPLADRDRIFERFTRLDAARGAATGGAGLGLAIAKDIVERHGGTISVDDQSSTVPGTTFVIELPVHDPTPCPGED